MWEKPDSTLGVFRSPFVQIGGTQDFVSNHRVFKGCDQTYDVEKGEHEDGPIQVPFALIFRPEAVHYRRVQSSEHSERLDCVH